MDYSAHPSRDFRSGDEGEFNIDPAAVGNEFNDVFRAAWVVAYDELIVSLGTEDDKAGVSEAFLVVGDV